MGVFDANLSSRGNPIQSGHTDIHNHNIRLKSLHGSNGFVAGCCLPNQLHIWVACEDLFENPADQGFIVYQQHANRCHLHSDFRTEREKPTRLKHNISGNILS